MLNIGNLVKINYDSAYREGYTDLTDAYNQGLIYRIEDAEDDTIDEYTSITVKCINQPDHPDYYYFAGYWACRYTRYHPHIYRRS